MLFRIRFGYLGLLSSLVLVIFVNCDTASSAKMNQLIAGDWSLEGATRNGMETSTLDNLFLEFDTEGKKLRTNLLGQTEDYTFEIDQHIVKFNEGKMKLEVETIDDSILIVNTVIQETPFKLWFTK